MCSCLLLVNSIFCCELPFFFYFLCVCQIYVAEVLITHFLHLLPSKVFITMWVPEWGQLWGVNSGSGCSSRSIFGLYFFTLIYSPLWLWSHLCLTLGHFWDQALDPYLCCVLFPTHYFWSIPFSALNSIFKTFSRVCQIYVAEVLIIHFCIYYHLRFLSPYQYQSKVNFCVGGQLWIWIQIHIWVVTFWF